MPVIRDPDQLPWDHSPGWASQDWAGAAVFGEAVPMEARRYRIEAGASCPRIPLAGGEALAYVISGSGTATAPAPGDGDGADGDTEFPLAPESLLWLAGCGDLAADAGPDGLDLLVAWPTGPDGPPPAPLRRVFAAADLPHLASTRDTRDRLDLVTADVPVGARRIRADRIIYHPGDTAAAHYHTDCHHVFCVLRGSGLLHSGEHALRLEAGMSVLVGPGEEHWFHDDRAEEFSFVEFWAPPPADTVWTVGGDRCTWAPALGAVTVPAAGQR